MVVQAAARQEAVLAPRAAEVRRAPRNRVLHSFLRHRLAVAGVVLLAAIAVLAILAPAISPYDPIEQDLTSAYLPPSPALLACAASVDSSYFRSGAFCTACM